MELAVARKSSLRDSTEEQVSTISLANFSGISVRVGDCKINFRQRIEVLTKPSSVLTMQLKKKWLL